MTERIEEKDGSLFLRGVKHDKERFDPAKERRERIATAVLSGMAGNPSWYWALSAPERAQPGNYGMDYDSPERMAARTVVYAVTWADALIAELDKA